MLFLRCWVHTLVSAEEVSCKRVVEEILFSWFMPQQGKGYWIVLGGGSLIHPHCHS